MREKPNDVVPFVELFRDHPRECGKNVSPALFAAETEGSPPRVREKLLLT